MTTDPFARATATRAHQTAQTLTSRLGELEQRVVRLEQRTPPFTGWCVYCGQPCRPRRRTCHAHTWTEGP